MDGFQLLSALMSESGGDSLRILRAHIAEQKDARRVHVSWSRPTESGTRRIRFDVHRLDTQIRVSGEFRSPNNQQLWLDHPGYGRGRLHLRRLCLAPSHGGDLHWHEFEGGRDARTFAVDAGHLDLSDPGTLLTEVFVPSLRITGLVYEGRLDV